MSPEEIKEVTEKDTVWGGFVGPDGALISYIVVDPRLPTRTHGLYYDDPGREDQPESFKGSSPLISFNIIDWKNAPLGQYHVDFYHFFLEHYSPAEVERHARFIGEPLVVAAK
jgi:hypothetical protein